eukprot:m.314791 g.314791  ORF g.314791 m.314791 type:complete len:57 (-) comp20273_c0_seq5:116-286(-)
MCCAGDGRLRGYTFLGLLTKLIETYDKTPQKTTRKTIMTFRSITSMHLPQFESLKI